MNRLIRNAFVLFKDAVENGEAICSLKGMIYINSRNSISLQDDIAKMLYVLRYGYALGYEYLKMLESILNDMGRRDCVKVHCIGEDYGILAVVLKILNSDGYCINISNSVNSDIYFYPCMLNSININKIPNNVYAAFSGHNDEKVKNVESFFNDKRLIYNGVDGRQSIPWEYPQDIAEYLWALNEKCINYKNGHNCFGVCARQLDAYPIMETGSIIGRVYRNCTDI